jgi:hypothetical protein
MDIQEALKFLQFRCRLRVDYRPTILHDGRMLYRIGGRLYSELQILEWVFSLPADLSRHVFAAGGCAGPIHVLTRTSTGGPAAFLFLPNRRTRRQSRYHPEHSESEVARSASASDTQ